MRRGRVRTLVCVYLSFLLVMLAPGCGRLSGVDDVQVSGGKQEIGATIWIGGKRFGTLAPRVEGDTTASLSKWLTNIPSGRQTILAVSARGESLRSEGIIGDFNVIDVSFARREILVNASWDIPRDDPNVRYSRDSAARDSTP